MRHLKIYFIYLIVLTISNQLTAQIYVNHAASGSNDGSSWTDAYSDLQDALNIATSSSEIWVATGSYLPASSDQTTAFDLIGTLYGGFIGTETIVTERNWAINVTTLSGDLNASGFADNGDSHTIVYATGVNPIVIDGFNIQYSHADGLGSLRDRSGAGIYSEDVTLSVINCTIQDNQAIGDGSNGIGGGLIGFGSVSIDLINSYFYNNEASANGGAYSGEGGTADFTNCTFNANQATKGGAIHFFIGDVNVKNSIFFANTGTNSNMNDDGGSGDGHLEFSLLDGAVPPVVIDDGNNILNTDPLLTDATAAIDALSVAVDAGNNSFNSTSRSYNAIGRILDGNISGVAVIDMGCYELTGAPPATTNYVGINTSTPRANLEVNGSILIGNTDPGVFADIPGSIRHNESDIQAFTTEWTSLTKGQIVDTDFKVGMGSSPSGTDFMFLADPSIVTVAPGESVFVTSTKSLGSTDAAGGKNLNLAICYRLSGTTGIPTITGTGTFGMRVPQNTRIPMTLSAIISGLDGTYECGLCGDPNNNTGWNSNEYSYTTAIVFKSPE